MDDKDRATFADKMTLDEIAENDVEMTRDAIKNANRYHFGKDQRKAMLFVRHCIDATLRHLGIKINPPATFAARNEYAKAIDRAMEEKQIRIESRNNYRGSEAWRCGVYIYQRDELVAFVSDILTERRTELDSISLKIGKESVGYMVVSNARLDETKRIYTMPAGIVAPSPAMVQ